MESTILYSKKINPYDLIRDYELKHCNLSLSGAQNIFIGYMRKTNNIRDDINSMTLEFYPEMTEPYLKSLKNNAKEKYNLDNVLLAHRVGEVGLRECLVVISCWAKHRNQCIDAVKYILEDLKHNAPLWKKEFYEDNSAEWVEKNTQI